MNTNKFYPELNRRIENAFIKLYDDNVAKIYRYIFLKVSSKEAAQDLTSETFLKTWEYIKKIQNPKSKIQNSNVKSQKLDNPAGFLYQVARNLVIDFYRQKGKNALPIESAIWQIENSKDNPGLNIEIDLDIKPIREAMLKIKKDYADIIIWYYLNELTVKEISELLKKSEGAVRVLIFRALKALKKRLKHETPKDRPTGQA